MFLNFFKRPLPIVLTTIIVGGVLLWIGSFTGWLSVVHGFETNQMPAYSFIANIFSGSILLKALFAFALMLTISLYILQLSSKYILIKTRTYLPALIYIVLTAGFISVKGLNPALISAIFVALSLNNLFQIFETKKPHNNLFMAGFFIALGSLFYLPATVFLLLVFVAMIILGTFNLRFFFISVFGFLTPWFFVFIYHYLFNNNIFAIPTIIEASWNFDNLCAHYTIMSYVFISTSGIIMFISLGYMLRMITTQKINIRKFHSVLIWFSIISLSTFFIIPSCSVELIYIAAIPISIQISKFFVSSRTRFWPEFWFVSLLATVILTQFF